MSDSITEFFDVYCMSCFMGGIPFGDSSWMNEEILKAGDSQ